MPNAHRTQKSADPVPKETNGDGAEYDRDRTQRQVIEDSLRCEHLATRRSSGCRSRCYRCDGVFFQVPVTVVEEGQDSDVGRSDADATGCSPSGFKFVAAGEKFGPGVAEEVCYEDDKCSLDGWGGGFELKQC